jgi:hypothetical protein
MDIVIVQQCDKLVDENDPDASVAGKQTEILAESSLMTSSDVHAFCLYWNNLLLGQARLGRLHDEAGSMMRFIGYEAYPGCT